MKKYLIATVLLIIVNGCGVEIKSVVENSTTRDPFTNPLIVIPYEIGKTKAFTAQLTNKIEEKFKLENKKVEILLVEQNRDDLTLNSSDDINTKINMHILQDKKDLILVFKLTHLQYYNNELHSVTYIITGTDLKTKKEIWKAEFSSTSSWGPALFAEKSAISIYEQLKADRVL